MPAATDDLPPILGPDDPEPVEVVRPDGGAPFFLTCEHAGKRLPARLGTLGLADADLERHIAWDIGAEAVARRLSERLDATLVLQRYSRLVVDCNRWPTADDFVVRESEGTIVPGNVDLPPAEVEARAREIYHPYHHRIRGALDARSAAGRPIVLVSVHSCTPVFHGVSRPWHVGVLYEHDRRFAGILLELLGDEAGLEVGENEPYFLSSDKDYAVPVHGQARGVPHVEFEIRQDLIAGADGQDEWAGRLAGVLREGLGRLKERGGL